MSSAPRILIIGAGPTGLGAAYRLHELGHEDFLVLEKNDFPGGLAASFVDGQGFTWDLGGHVQFSHYDYFDQVMDRALGNAWIHHTRQSHIRIFGTFVPYPLQHNIRSLPKEQLWRCVDGLLRTRLDGARSVGNFKEWLLATFGDGLCEVFFFPYNFKIWAHPLESIGHTWVRGYVAEVDLYRVLRNVVLELDDPAWGWNRTFRFPLHGGTGAIWRAVAGLLPASKLRYRTEVDRINPDRHLVRTLDGAEHRYDCLISTMPLHLLAARSNSQKWLSLAQRLRYTSTHVVGVGIQGTCPDELCAKNWIYFPEADCPFYRVTVFSNYSPYNVPVPGKYWSLMAEVSESHYRLVDRGRVVDDVLAGLKTVGLLPSETEIVSTWHTFLPTGYPLPTVNRDLILSELLPCLEHTDIFSRGRFGAWKYEVSSQDHSFMQGVEVVDRLLTGAPEVTIVCPDKINGGKRQTSQSPASRRSSTTAEFYPKSAESPVLTVARERFVKGDAG